MTEDKKFALRTVLEHGLSRIIISCTWYEFSIWKPNSLRKYYQLVKTAGIFAGWLKKLAFYSAVDFVGFDEVMFWQEYELLDKKFPNNNFIMTRQFYEQTLQRVTVDKGRIN